MGSKVCPWHTVAVAELGPTFSASSLTPCRLPEHHSSPLLPLHAHPHRAPRPPPHNTLHRPEAQAMHRRPSAHMVSPIRHSWAWRCPLPILSPAKTLPLPQLDPASSLKIPLTGPELVSQGNLSILSGALVF